MAKLKAGAALSPAERRTKEVEKAFSPWDGSHLELTRAIKKVMNNPDSYKHVETRYTDLGDTLMVRTTFRGTNKFGAVVTNTVAATVSLDGRVIDMAQTK